MKMKNIFIIGLIVFLCTCAGNPVQGSNSSHSTNEDQLDIAIRETSAYLNKNLTVGNKIAILNIQSDSSVLSNYIIDELISNIINDQKFSIIERQQLDAIRAELNFQLSGEVDDNSAQRLGQMLGAQNIITGNVTKIGDRYRLTVRALNVESAQIVGQFNRNISNSSTINALIQTPSTDSIAADSTQTTLSATQISTGATPQAQLVDRSIPVPTGLRAVPDSYTAIQITWGPVPTITEYKLFVSATSNGAYTFLANINGLSYLHDGMTPNTTRFYRVSAVGNNGRESPFSTAINGTTRQIPSPTGITAETRSASEIRLEWNPVAGASHYRVYGSASSGNSQPLLISTNENTFTHSSLQQMTTYYYRVSAVLNELEGGQSAVLSASTPQAPVTPPGNTLAQQLDFIANQGGNGTVYEIVVNENVSMNPVTVSTRGRNITVIIRSTNPQDVKTIQLTGQGYLFTLDASITVRFQNIILRGNSSNNKALILVGPAKLILDHGSKIIGNTNIEGDLLGGGICINGGTLDIYENAEISGNIVQDRRQNTRSGRGGGIYVGSGSVNIFGGLISGNSSYLGGGIFISGISTVNMSGGVISKNNANFLGGGIYIDLERNNRNNSISYGSFMKCAISGNDTSGIIYGNFGENANRANSGGHAIFRNSYGKPPRRNITLSYYDEINSGSNDGWEEQ